MVIFVYFYDVIIFNVTILSLINVVVRLRLWRHFLPILSHLII